MERFNPMKMMNRNGTLEPSFDPLVLGKMKVETYNASTGTLTGYHCTKCRNRGSIAHLRDDGSISIGECSCIPVRRSVREMEKSGLKDFVQEKTFGTFQTEEYLLFRYHRAELRADVLKVGHHGSAASSSLRFLQVVSPALSVISVGRGNEYGHPTAETLLRLSLAKSRVLRTDEAPAVQITLDGKEARVVE